MRNNTEVTIKFFKMYFKILLATIYIKSKYWNDKVK